MSRQTTTTFHLKPADASKAIHVHTKVRLVPFPASQRMGGKRYLHPEGETVVATSGEDRRWWMSLIASGDAIKLDRSEVRAEPYRGPDPVDNGSENVPTLVPAGETKSKKGGK